MVVLVSFVMSGKKFYNLENCELTINGKKVDGFIPLENDIKFKYKKPKFKKVCCIPLGSFITGDMKRCEDVLDCWFESGSMPFAQVHYPFEFKVSKL